MFSYGHSNIIVASEHQGTYVCVYNNDAKTLIETEPYTLDVLPEGSVPSADAVGLALLVGAFAMGGMAAFIPLARRASRICWSVATMRSNAART